MQPNEDLLSASNLSSTVTYFLLTFAVTSVSVSRKRKLMNANQKEEKKNTRGQGTRSGPISGFLYL